MLEQSVGGDLDSSLASFGAEIPEAATMLGCPGMPTTKRLEPSRQSACTVFHKPTRPEVEAAVRTLLAWTGDDPDRAGLARTPERVADAFTELFAGYSDDPVAILRRGILPDAADGRLVVLRDIRFVSMCEHHLLPFTGYVHVGFLARHSLVGIGAIAGAVLTLARRLQIQERLTDEVAQAVHTALEPYCSAVIIEAEHQCIAARGSKLQARLMTSRQLGGESRSAELLNALIGSSQVPR